MKIPKDIIQLQDDIIKFGSRVQTSSAKKINEKQHIPYNIYLVFYKICAYAITLHRAVISLCEKGWIHVTPLLLRTILECSANCLAITNNEMPEYMAFKYLYHPYVASLIEEKVSKDLKDKARYEIEKGKARIKNKKVLEMAETFISQKRLDMFWFRPEEKNISSIINKYGGEDTRQIYKIFSMSVHAGHFGMFIFRDDSDEIDINPSADLRRAKIAILASCRYLLELLYMRNISENLGFVFRYRELLERFLSFEKDVRILE